MKVEIAIFAVLGAIALYPVYRLLRLLRRFRAVRRLERCFQYRLIWNTGITWIGGVLISLYLLINGFVLVLLRGNLERWAGVIAAVNSIPLFLGGRRNIFIYYFGLNAHNLTHCTIGFVVIFEGLLHAGLALSRTRSRTSPWDYLAAASLLSILLTSIPPVRPWLCRIFGVAVWWLAHLLFAIANVAGMAGYVGVARPVVDASLSAVVSIYLSGTLWILGAGYRYIRRRRTPASIKSDRGHSESTELIVRCSPRFSVFPGCYFYVYYPRQFGFKSLHFDMLVDSLPLTLAWGPEASDDSSKEKLITFVVSHGDCTSGFIPFRSGQEILLDGPYGRDMNAAACTTMVLVARGSGIVGLLSFASHQVGRYKHKISRKEKRRIDILWVLDDVGQQDLVGDRLWELQNMDQDSNTVVWLLYPSHTKEEDVKLPFQEKEGYWTRYLADNYEAYLGSLMFDCPSENCIVIACGDPAFSAAIRRETAAKVEPAVKFAEVQYRPHRPAARTVDEEANVGPKASPDGRAVKRIRSGPREIGLRKSADVPPGGQELEEIKLTSVDQP